MKIVYCLAGTYNSGGMERIVINKANWLALQGYDVTIVTTEQDGRLDFFPLHKNVKRIDLNILYSKTNSFKVIKKGVSRYRLQKKHKTKLTDLLLSIKPNIVISTFGNEVGFLPSIKDGSIKIAEIHFSRWYRLQLNRTGIWKLIDKYLTYTDFKILKKYNRFVCLTNEDKQNWSGITNIEVIPNFIDSRAMSPAPLRAKSMIAVGRLSYQKGYDRLIRAWSIVAMNYPDWRLNIFGGGELKDKLIRQISELDLSKQIQIHNPTNEIIKEYYRNSGLILSSRYEGLPMVILEGMSVGLPIISFDCQCGPKDLIKDGVNGLLVEEGNITDMANAIKSIINNADLRENMGANAFEDAKNFDMDSVMEKWTALFNSLAVELTNSNLQ
ncbi:MAG: glycosyltransferase family 4 protein [Muribaculaceae bacterium]|nr:glycosyltransferase family 4 protein [Muribaculaceae bacterium]